MPAPDVLVVGAGIVGAACAEALTAAGLSVEILESRFAGGGATAAAMGHVVVMDDSEAQFALTKLSVVLHFGHAEGGGVAKPQWWQTSWRLKR